MRDPSRPPRDWRSLSEDTQIELRIAFGHYLDSLPPTCSLGTKIERFRHWLAEHGIRYDADAPERHPPGG
jgi:hypothetical protein